MHLNELKISGKPGLQTAAHPAAAFSPKIHTYSAKESIHALKRTQGTARV